ncbi:glucose 1-dehydrogenase [Spirosoma linguale]|uniref:Short-chain dehydrogenase/reductase SDR n=1 Tax=Spirosoma linguale (strain ATCC 33905 / DSM 74 / LMG 10896 / Claus 1) TaxID=504472 RepID=D2QRU1_SPILD|nr:short-chain dehydrogenase/reductase SDR [Spirosoma linguale DSM 74]
MISFLHQVAFVTGAGSGIGRATALAFAGAGARVVVAEINEESGRETVGHIHQSGGDALFVACDVAEPAQINAAIQQTVDTYGRLDIAINNAGIGGRYGRFTEQTPEDFDRIMAVNVGGVFYCMQAQIRQMLLQQKGTKAEGKTAESNPMESFPVGGRIVNVASIAGVRGMPMGAPYSASKHAVIGLTKTAALEYVKQNIRINAVCPAYTNSAMVDGLISAAPAMEDRMRRMIPLGRFGQPEEIAQAILWLCADDNTFFTGQTLQLDGGLTAG